MTPYANTKAIATILGIIVYLIAQFFPTIPKIDEETVQWISGMIAYALGNWIVGRELNPAGIVSRSKAPEQLKELRDNEQ